MMPRVVAVIGIRIIAVWIMLQGVLGAIVVVSLATRGVPLMRSPRAATALVAESERVRDPVRTSAIIWSTLPSVAAQLGIGAVLLFFSNPIGRALARRVE